MLTTLKRWITPPVFDDEAKTHQAFLLHVILWALIFVPFPYAVYSVLRTPEFTTRALTQSIVGESLTIFLMIILRRGHVRLVEVMQNLIDNAAKFMGGQPQPVIQIGTRGTLENMPVFFVRDNGIGIESQYQERIFGIFNKLDPVSEGTGIGLTLVKRIVEVHGGKIWIESEGAGKGSAFCFTLPTS